MLSRLTAALCSVAIVNTACTVVVQEVTLEKGDTGATSWTGWTPPDADDSSTGDAVEGDTSSTGAASSSTGAPEESTTGAAGSSSAGGDPIEEGSTSDDASTTTGESSSTSTGDAPIEEGTSTTSGESSSTTGEPEPPPPPPVQCMQLDPGACGVGLCLAPSLLCQGDESFLPGGSLQPGEAQVVASNADQQRVVHVLDLPAGPVNAVVTPLTGGTQVDYRLYTATGTLAAAGSPAGVAKIGIEVAQPSVYLLVIGEVSAKPMTHEVKVVTVPTKQHNDLCDTDAQCLSSFCRASAFDADTRCLTPCTRNTVLDCAGKGLPGLCVETGDDKTPLCAGNHTFGNDGDNRRVTLNQQGWNVAAITTEDDVDAHLIDLSAVPVGNYRAHLITNNGANVTATWLDATGKTLLSKIVKPAGGDFGPALGGGYAFLLVSSGKPGLNGYRVEAVAF